MKRMTQRIGGLLLALTLLLVANAPEAAAKKPWEKIKIPELNPITMPAYERIELDNGMIVYLAEDHQLPLVELSATIEVGSIFEPADKVGLAAMTGTVMRTGGTESRNGDDIDELVEARGLVVETRIGSSNGSAYLSAMTEDLELGLDLLADILMHPAFPEDKIKLAKEEQKAGISRRNDEPMTIAQREVRKVVFGADHPLALHPEYDTIAAVTRQDMLDFHADWFHPDRMYLVVIGDFESTQLLGMLEEKFAGWAKAERPLPADPEIPDFPRTVNVVDKDDLTQTTIMMGHKGVRADSPYYAGVQVGNRILGGGFGNRLFNEVRSRQGLAYAVGSAPGTGFRYPGLFFAYTMTKSESTELATQAILAEIQRMLDEEVTDEELVNATDGILNSEVFNFDTKREILDRLVMYERLGYAPDFLQKYQESVKRMTKQEILEAVRAVWHPDQMSILAVGNYQEFDGDLSTFGPVTMVDITIPEPALEIPEATAASLEAGMSLMLAGREAVGGKKISDLKSYFEKTVLSATIQGMAMDFTTEQTVVFPDRSHTMIKTPFGNQSIVVAGDKGWSTSPMGSKDLEGDELAHSRDEINTSALGIFKNLEQLTCQALTDQEVEGVACHPVHVTGIGSDYQIFFLWAADSRVFMIQSPGTSPMTGAPVTQKIYIDDYLEVDGYIVSKKIRLYFDDELFGEGITEEFKANTQVDGSLFVQD